MGVSLVFVFSKRGIREKLCSIIEGEGARGMLGRRFHCLGICGLNTISFTFLEKK